MADELKELLQKQYYDAKIKFNYYLLGITSAILGLSVKFVEPDESDIFTFLIFVSWGAFVVSILAGIKWQRLWIFWLNHLHSGYTEYNNDDADKTNKLSNKLADAEVTQVISFVVGIVAIALFKVINYYF